MYVLTKEGAEYLKRGLPEKKLVQLLEKNPVDITTAKGRISNFDIAFMWCKKKNLVEVKGGVIHLKKRDSFPEEKALEDISKGLDIGSEIAATLLKRKLIEVARETITKRAEALAGKEVASLTEDVIKTGVWKRVKFRPYNVGVAGAKINIGKRQPYNRFLSQVRQMLVEMGFTEMKGPTIEAEFWNFDALFQPQNHPSRDWTQTYSLKYPQYGDLPGRDLVSRVQAAHENGWKTGSAGWGYKWDPAKAARLMPRAHGTAASARTLPKAHIPGKYFAISRCYRPDVIDATHGIEFNQTEGIVLDESLSFRSLLGVLKEFSMDFAGADQVRFYADYYPFTEPSVQLSAKHPELGWIELGGAGIFREELTKPLGVDVPVIAWGLGIDRLAMFKLKLNDIRNLFSQNLEWLRSATVQ